MNQLCFNCLFFCLIITHFSCKTHKQNSENFLEVQITVTQTESYCGGARPHQELLDELAIEKLLPNKKMFIRKGDFNDISKPIILEIETNENGVANFKLPEGTYILIDEKKKDESKFNDYKNRYAKKSISWDVINLDCLKEYFSKPDMIFTVKKGNRNSLKINYHKGCFWTSVPCTMYIGNLPP